MRAIRVHTPGDEANLQLDEIPIPEPATGQVRIKLAAIGVNFIDIYQRQGVYTVPLPFISGSEGAGTVDAVGPGVNDFQPGQRVAYAQSLGAYAEYSVVPARNLVHVPEGVSDEIAAATMLQGMTAHYLARSTWEIQPGEAVLIHAGAGGVGLLLTQIAKKLGARVLATVSTPAKAELARGAGADEVTDYADFVQVARRFTNGRGVDVVYDSVGKDTFDRSLDCLRPRGLLALFGGSSGQVPPFNLQLLNQKGSLFVTRPTLGNYIATPEELRWRSGELFGWIADGSLSVRIDRILPLEQAGEAQRALAGRETTGKVLLRP